MKGYAATPPWKRRWRRPTVAVVALVFLSMLVPIAFLLGFHNRIPSGFLTDDRFPLETSFRNNGRVDSVQESFEVAHSRFDNIIKKFGVSPIKEITEKEVMQPPNLTVNAKMDTVTLVKHVLSSRKNDSIQLHLKNLPSPINSQFHLKRNLSPFKPKESSSHSKAMSTRQIVKAGLPPSINKNNSGGEATEVVVDGTDMLCQIEFGSYCLWSAEHKVTMKDSLVKRLKDQLFVARAYYPSIAKLKARQNLAHEIKQNIQDHEKILSDSISDTDLSPLILLQYYLPPHQEALMKDLYIVRHLHTHHNTFKVDGSDCLSILNKIKKMDETIGKAKRCSIDCFNVDKKLRQILDLSEDEVHFHMKQSAFLYNLGVQTMPKCLHCFFMRLTVEYFRSASTNKDLHAQKSWNAKFRHYVLFSVNVLAASVTVNSTVMNSKITENMVFHLITDKQNYYAMKYWFARYSFKEASIHVINIDKFKENHSHKFASPQLPLSEEFRISMRNVNHSISQMKTEYISVFGHSHFLLPVLLKNLKKVVILDDDVVIQQDLSSLWDLDMEGKVIGAVEFCGITLGQLKAYLARNTYDPNSCVWMSGLNVVDLEMWRKHNVTSIYKRLLWKMKNMNEVPWSTVMLPTSLLAFRNLVYLLPGPWTLSGLGYDYRIRDADISKAVALHYNGNMKPWLELGIPRYKSHWKKFLKKGDHFMSDCNVNL